MLAALGAYESIRLIFCSSLCPLWLIRLGVEDFAKHLEQFAETLGRLLRRRFTLGVPDQRAHPLGIGLGVGGNEFTQGGLVREQAGAPALDAVQPGGFLVGTAFPGIELGADRRGVHVAHQSADVLHLPPQGAELGDAARLVDCFDQSGRRFQLLQLVRAQGHQLLADVLQRVALLLAPRLAGRRIVVHRILWFWGRDHVNWYHSENSIRGAPVQARRFTFRIPQNVSTGDFTHSLPILRQIAKDVLDHAATQGASASEVEVSEGFGQSVTVRRGEVETIEYNRDKGMGVTVYVGKQRGHASTSDFSPRALRDTVDAALSIARLTASDEYSGLADSELLARDFPDLDLFHAWPISVEQAIEMAQACEDAAFAADARVSNSEGAAVSVQQSHFAYGNSSGFLAGYPSSRHSVSCAVIAGKDEAMQRDDWYATARAAGDLEAAADVGATAGRRAARRVGARKISTMRVPVLFEAPIASSLLGHFVSAVSGGSLYRKSSFLLDSLGKQVFPANIHIRDLPHLKRGLASAGFDDEGVATRTRDIVDGGMLQGYFLGSYSARKLGLQSTGNAGGNYNLILESTGEDFEKLLRKMGRGLLVTELLGQGINMVTGDYSRGAAGFWIENGEIAYPVNEVTVAGNLKDMFMNVAAVGSDRIARGSRQTGSLLVEGMTVAGE